ncbi:hypothetical protein AAMO2058_001306900 [Amorphochlora amoebiformis]
MCQTLSYLGIHGLGPEIVRKAKFDHPSSLTPLWQSLHDIVMISIIRLRYPNITPREYAQAIRRAWDTRKNDAVARSYVKAQLGRLGYSKAYSMSPNLRSSRALLLALAWIIDKLGLVPYAVSSLLTQAYSSQHLPPFPGDTYAIQRVRLIGRRAGANIYRKYNTWLGVQHTGLSKKNALLHKINQIFVLIGRLRHACGQLNVYQRYRTKLALKLRKIQTKGLFGWGLTASLFEELSMSSGSVLDVQISNMANFSAISRAVLYLFASGSSCRERLGGNDISTPGYQDMTIWKKWIKTVQDLDDREGLPAREEDRGYDGFNFDIKLGEESKNARNSSRETIYGADKEMQDILGTFTLPPGTMLIHKTQEDGTGDGESICRVDNPESFELLRKSVHISTKKHERIFEQARKLLGEIGKRKELNGIILHI